LGVSQSTVREALSRLVAEGMAVHVPYKGVKAVSLPLEELEDAYETRAVLQGLAMQHAASRISLEGLARMRELLPQTIMDRGPHSAEQAWEANNEFHWIAVRASGRRHLIRLLGQVWDLTNAYGLVSRRSDAELLDFAERELKDHTQILEALEAGDGQRARKLTEEHMHRTLHLLRTMISEQEE
jgi:DNA-binding GntR family transcriptional regulator